MPTSSTLVVSRMLAKVTLHCTSLLPLVHQVVPAKLTLRTVTAVADEPIFIDKSGAEAPPKELLMVAVPAATGRSLLSKVELPRLAINLAIVVSVTWTVVEAACTGTGMVGSVRI